LLNVLADWFEGYARYKPHALYVTTNSDYGSRPPNVHTMPNMFFDRPQKFTDVCLQRTAIIYTMCTITHTLQESTAACFTIQTRSTTFPFDLELLISTVRCQLHMPQEIGIKFELSVNSRFGVKALTISTVLVWRVIITIITCRRRSALLSAFQVFSAIVERTAVRHQSAPSLISVLLRQRFKTFLFRHS